MAMDVAGAEALLKAAPSRTPEHLRSHIFPGEQRRPSGPAGWLITVASAGLILFTLYMGLFGAIGQIGTNALHLAITIPLSILVYRADKKPPERGEQPSRLDWLLAALACASFLWAYWWQDRFEQRMIYVDEVEWPDLLMGIIAIVMTLEATRRTLDMVIVWMTLAFGCYALFGPYFPGLFEHKGTTIVMLVEHLYLIPEGLFNVIMTIAATFLFTFLLFGALLQVSGGERAFMAMAMAFAGGLRGGPAKVATVASALMGTISGSTVSNVVTTGSLTIPLMKKIGYRPEEAGAIETVASVGGALMPPVMGAGVFLMSALTGLPLITILQYSVAPAILYYTSLYFYVDIKARKHRLQGLPREVLPARLDSIFRALHLFIPIGVLIWLMMIGYTPFFASSACVIVVFFAAQLRRETRISLHQLLVGLEAATRLGLTVSSLSAASALIFGVMTITGLLVKATSIFLALAGGSLPILLVLIGVAAYIVGLGLPVTATYVIVAALGTSALGELGVGILAAHLVIFWNAQNATISPPVALTAHVAATIAKANSLRTANWAVLMAKPIFIMPFVFAYGNFLHDDPLEILFEFAGQFAFYASMPVVIEGFLLGPVGILARALFALGGAASFWSTFGPSSEGWPWFLAALALFGSAYALHRAETRAAAGEAGAGSVAPTAIEEGGE